MYVGDIEVEMKENMQKDKVSIIIPVYNVEQYLERCINSVLNQTYTNIEIILVDDGSTDNSGAICDKYKDMDNRIDVIHKKNGGLSSARNIAIPLIKGTYVVFVDSDDWIDSDMITDMVKIIKEYDADIVSCEVVRTTGVDNNDYKKKYDKSITTYTKDEYLQIYFKIKGNKTIYYAHSKIYKKEVIEENLYPIGLTSEDVVGTLKTILNSNKIVNVNYPYYNYYINNNSITGSFSEKDFDLLDIWDEVIDICKKNDNGAYVNYAKLNRNRINYTLLMRMAINLKYKDMDKLYKDKKIQLLNNLKKNKKEILNNKLPLSRKITIQMICLNYRLSCWLFYALGKRGK